MEDALRRKYETSTALAIGMCTYVETMSVRIYVSSFECAERRVTSSISRFMVRVVSRLRL